MRTYTDEELLKAMQQAPAPIREALENGDFIAETIAVIGKKYGLHIDVVGKIAELTRNILLGLSTPEEFVRDLGSSGMDEVHAKTMLGDVSKAIFVPLRNKMRSTGTPANAEKGAHFHLQNKIPPPMAMRTPVRPVQSSGPVPHVNANSPLHKAIASAMSGAPVSRPDMQMLSDHEEPHIEFHRAPAAPAAPVAAAPARPPVPPTEARPLPPPPNLPGALPPKSAPPSGSDPYREPIA